jgi:hypothetical protein
MRKSNRVRFRDILDHPRRLRNFAMMNDGRYKIYSRYEYRFTDITARPHPQSDTLRGNIVHEIFAHQIRHARVLKLVLKQTSFIYNA